MNNQTADIEPVSIEPVSIEPTIKINLDPNFEGNAAAPDFEFIIDNTPDSKCCQYLKLAAVILFISLIIIIIIVSVI
jgi:hypothetical protein